MEINQPLSSAQDPDSELSHQQPSEQPLTGPADQSEDELCRRIASYPFNTDNDYLLGLAAILGHPDTPPTSAELSSGQDLVLQAQCFYLTRKFGLPHINPDVYKSWLSRQAINTNSSSQSSGQIQNQIPPRPSTPTPQTAALASTTPVQPHGQSISGSTSAPSSQSPSEPSPPYPTSFAEIVDLITQNKPIPGIEEIPNTVLEPGSSKQDHAPRRKKPWEKDLAQEDAGGGSVSVDVEERKKTGEGVMKILQPGAVPDSGLVAKD